jgi:hypothetical protein
MKRKRTTTAHSRPRAGATARTGEGSAGPHRAIQQGNQGRRALWTLIFLGFAVRVAIGLCSYGSNDASTFFWFAQDIRHHGLTTAYAANPEQNHPPIPLLWALLVCYVGEKFGNPLDPFFFLFKVPSLAADGLTAYLLYRIWSRRDGPARGLSAAALFAWALCPILVSSYHGNTDSIYGALSLLSVYLLAERNRPGLSGLALAAAINVKLIPVLLVPGMLLGLRHRRDVLAYLGGLAVGVLPFVPLLFMIGPEFYRNALTYNSQPDRWGLMLPLTWNRTAPLSLPEDRLLILFKDYGRYLILALIAAWSIVAARLRRWTPYEIAAVTYAIFLVFASGFGVQYAVIVVPLLFAVAPRLAGIYSAFAGLFLLAAYYFFWDGRFPVGSFFSDYVPHESAAAGLGAWGCLVYFLIRTIFRRADHAIAQGAILAKPQATA